MSYIKTKRGNFVPMSAVDVIIPKEKGSLVKLASGKSFVDDRTPEDIFDSLTPTGSDDSILVRSVYRELEEIRKESSASLSKIRSENEVAHESNKNRIDIVLSRLEAQCKVASDNVAKATAQLNVQTDKVVGVSMRQDTSVKQLNEAVQSVASMTKELEDAINACD